MIGHSYTTLQRPVGVCLPTLDRLWSGSTGRTKCVRWIMESALLVGSRTRPSMLVMLLVARYRRDSIYTPAHHTDSPASLVKK